jgi:hypothetical protein
MSFESPLLPKSAPEKHKSETKEDRFKLFEQSPKLDQALEIARAYFSAELGYDEVEDQLMELFEASDKESFDCHSLASSIMRREFGIQMAPTPTFERPKRSDYRYSVEWQDELVNRLHAMLESADGEAYKKFMMGFTENVAEQSVQVPIPHVDLPKTDQDAEEYIQTASKLVEKIASYLEQHPSSRYLLISAGDGDTFYDAHSMIILGRDEKSNDILVLEKREMGASIDVRKLSDVIYSHMYGAGLPSRMHHTIKLNLLKRPVQEIVESK